MSRIIARFSARVVRSARSTWPAWDFATRVTTEAPESTQRADQGVVGRIAAGPPGRAERRERGVAQAQLVLGAREELGVLRVRAGPAALDEADAELVEVGRDGQLVGHGEVEPLLLRAIAQGGVVDVQVGHGSVLVSSVSSRVLVVILPAPPLAARGVSANEKDPPGREVCATRRARRARE